jgi:uncharacterized membrane protein YidH (DUF202 family)
VIDGPRADPELTPRGTAQERTELAWNRSGLAVLVCLAAVVRRFWPLDSTGAVVVLVCGAAGGVAWVIAIRSGRRIAERSQRDGVLGSTIIGWMTAATLVFAAAGLVLTIFPPR